MMITHRSNNKFFAHRVAAVIVDHGRVLLYRAEHNPFWALPGGRVELLESSAEALLREMREELNVEVKIARLMWVVENFFSEKDLQHHEIGLYYLVHLPVDARVFSNEEHFTAVEQYGESNEPTRLIFEWFPCDPASLEKIYLLPAFLHRG